jgi:hypothetical protein
VSIHSSEDKGRQPVRLQQVLLTDEDERPFNLARVAVSNMSPGEKLPHVPKVFIYSFLFYSSRNLLKGKTSFRVTLGV